MSFRHACPLIFCASVALVRELVRSFVHESAALVCALVRSLLWESVALVRELVRLTDRASVALVHGGQNCCFSLAFL